MFQEEEPDRWTCFHDYAEVVESASVTVNLPCHAIICALKAILNAGVNAVRLDIS